MHHCANVEFPWCRWSNFLVPRLQIPSIQPTFSPLNIVRIPTKIGLDNPSAIVLRSVFWMRIECAIYTDRVSRGDVISILLENPTKTRSTSKCEAIRVMRRASIMFSAGILPFGKLLTSSFPPIMVQFQWPILLQRSHELRRRSSQVPFLHVKLYKSRHDTALVF